MLPLLSDCHLPQDTSSLLSMCITWLSPKLNSPGLASAAPVHEHLSPPPLPKGPAPSCHLQTQSPSVTLTAYQVGHKLLCLAFKVLCNRAPNLLFSAHLLPLLFMSLRFQPNCRTIWSISGPSVFSCILQLELPLFLVLSLELVYFTIAM